jgi:5'-3' exonuclease
VSSVLLVDLSNLVHREFAVRGQDGDINATATAVVAQVRRLATGQPHVAICCDSGKSFRKAINPEYKAQRAERDPALYHQMRTAIELLKADGFPVWAVPDMEADDIIATATTRVLNDIDGEGLPRHDVLIVSSDKDLCAMIGPFVQMKRPDTGAVVDSDAVFAKFGVQPSQMLDYLSLCGDASDNIKGAKGVGPKTAAGLLARFGTLDELYADFTKATATERKALGFTPALAASLEEFATRRDEVRALITLRTDVPINFDEVFAPRVAVAAAEYDPEADYAAEDGVAAMPEDVQQQDEVVTGVIEPAADERPAPAEAPKVEQQKATPVETALVPRTGEILPAYEQRMLPRDLREARIIAKDIHDAHLFSAFGSPQAVLTAVMLGSEFGMPPVASLRGVHIIEGKPSMSAGLMAAVVMKSGLAEYFEPVEVGPESVTFETKRKGARNPLRITHTIEMAKQAWNKGKTDAEREASWKASGWGRNPTDMLVARCQSRLARYAYPDLLAGMYSPEELREVADEAVA